MPYDLFISYAHRDDRPTIEGRPRSTVAELKRQLEKHAHPKPPDPSRSRFRVCTDTEDLELQATVSDAQREALKQSASLLVVCSQGSAESDYVREEIETFQTLKGSEAPILTANAGLRPHEAFPDLFEEGALGADLAPTEDMTLAQWRAKLASEAHKIVAKVWDLPLEEVHDRFRLARRRQRIRNALLAISAAALLLVAWLLVHQVGVSRQEEQKRLREEYNAVMRDVQRAYEDGQITHARQLLEQTRGPDWRAHRSFAWKYFERRTHASAGVLESESAAGWSLAMAPDGERLAAGMGSSVRIWNWRRQQLEHTLRGHERQVHSIAFSPDARKVASGGQDRTVRIWNAETGEQLALLEGHTEPVWSLAFSSGGATIVSVAGAGDRGEVLLWDSDSRSLAAKWTYDEPVRAVDVAQSLIALGIGRQMSESWIEIRDLETHEITTKLEDQARIQAVRFFPGAETLASVGTSNLAYRWDLKTQRVIRRYYGHMSAIDDLAVSPDGRLLASGSSDGTVRIWDAETGKELAVLRGHIDDAQTESSVTAVAFSPDGNTLASTGTSMTLRLWDVERAQSGKILPHESPVLDIALSPDESLLASATRDGMLRIWQTQTLQLQLERQLSSERLTSVAFSTDGATLAAGGNDGTVRLLEPKTGRVLETIDTGWSWVATLDWTEGFLAAAGGDHGERGGLALWRPPSSSPALSWFGAEDVLQKIDLDPEDQIFVAASEDAVFEIDAKDASLVRRTAGNLPVAFNDRSSLLAYGSHPAIQLRDLESGDVTAQLLGHKGWVNDVTFHPDGETVATAGSDGTIRLWDVVTGDQRLVIQGHEDQALVLLFAGDGEKLFSAGSDDAVRVWDVSGSDP